VTSCKRDTEASSDYIVLKAHPYIQHICIFQLSCYNINNINSVKLFVKITVLPLRTLRFLEIKTRKPTDELG